MATPVLKFSISSNFIFLQDTWVEFIKVEFLTDRELMEMFPEQPKFTLGTGLGTEPLGCSMDEDKDGGIVLLHLHLSLPLTLPFPLGGEE